MTHPDGDKTVEIDKAVEFHDSPALEPSGSDPIAPAPIARPEADVPDPASALPTPSEDDSDSYYAHAFASEDGDVTDAQSPAMAPTPVGATPASPAMADAVPPPQRARQASPLHLHEDDASPDVGATPCVDLTVEPPDEPDIARPLAYESPVDPRSVAADGGGWTIPFLCAGIGLIACCLIIPLADSNRRAAYERQQLRRDLDNLQHQSLVNDQFIREVNEDPTLAERLAQRQMKTIRAGTKVLSLPGSGSNDMSPFQIVAVDPPPPLPPYRAVGGTLATLCCRPRSRLYLIGAGLLLMAGGLVLGSGPRSSMPG